MSEANDFKEVYLKYSDRIFRYLYGHTGDFYLSEDLTSEVFSRAWRLWASVKRDFIQAWLFKIAHNLMVDYWRKKKEKRLDEMKIVSYDEDLLGKIQKDEEITKLKHALSLLPENLKRIIILRFVEDLSAKEAGNILEISEVNVRVLQHRALVKLREILKNEKRY